MTRPLMNSMGLTTAVCLAVLSALLLSGSAGAISKGSRLSDAPLDLIPVVSEGLQSAKDALDKKSDNSSSTPPANNTNTQSNNSSIPAPAQQNTQSMPQQSAAKADQNATNIL